MGIYALSHGIGFGAQITHFGESSEEWKVYSVVFAEVEIPPPLPWDHVEKPTMTIRPLGALSGSLDPSTFPKLTVAIDFNGFGSWGWDRRAWPKKAQLVLIVVFERGGQQCLATGTMTYVRKSTEPMEVVDGFSDPQVDETLKAIQNVRRHPKDEMVVRSPAAGPLSAKATPSAAVEYWTTRGVVLAEVKTITPPKSGAAPSTLVLRPELTFGGTFDAGETPEVIAAAAFADFRPETVPAVGDKVLVLLQRDGETYRVANELPEFMPEQRGRHASICVVKGFSDPRVRETIKALKLRRQAESDAKPTRRADR